MLLFLWNAYLVLSVTFRAGKRATGHYFHAEHIHISRSICDIRLLETILIYSRKYIAYGVDHTSFLILKIVRSRLRTLLLLPPPKLITLTVFG